MTQTQLKKQPSPWSKTPTLSRILLVDDDRIMLTVMTGLLDKLGYDHIVATDGKEACEIILRDRDAIVAVLLDREMPEMNGLEVVEWLKGDPDLRRIPVIMQTGADQPDQIKEGIDAGVFYYLTKPYQEGVLQSVLQSALREAKQQRYRLAEMRKRETSFSLMRTASFSFRTLNEGENLSCFLANCFPEGDRVVGGLGELLVNAVEHGNLAISYEEKTELVKQGKWRDEVNRRLGLPEFSDRWAKVEFRRTETEATVVIRDQGNGFDWRDYMTIAPARALDNHGRGIAQANLLSFDGLTYNDAGNEVTATISLSADPDS